MERRPTIEEVIDRLRLFVGRQVAWSTLSGGHMNEIFLIETEDERYVVRVPDPSGGALIPDRRNERHNTIAAAQAGVTPRVLEVIEDWNVMVVEYVEGQPLDEESLDSSTQVSRIADLYRRLHASSRFVTDFDMYEEGQRWLRVCRQRGIAVPDGLDERMDRVALASRALGAGSAASVPCHNDPDWGNFIDDGDRLWIIDFEFSGNNDPCYDVGDVANQWDMDEDWRARLCEAYFGVVDRRLLARMTLHAVMSNVGWSLWAAAQTGLSSLDINYLRISSEYRDAAIATIDSAEFASAVRLVSGDNAIDPA